MSQTINREQIVSTLTSAGEAFLVEALPPKYYQGGHLPGALNIPLSATDEDVAQALPDRRKTVITYCTDPSCMNSRQLAERLETLGFEDVRVYIGGKSDWTEARLPLEEGA